MWKELKHDIKLMEHAQNLQVKCPCNISSCHWTPVIFLRCLKCVKYNPYSKHSNFILLSLSSLEKGQVKFKCGRGSKTSLVFLICPILWIIQSDFGLQKHWFLNPHSSSKADVLQPKACLVVCAIFPSWRPWPTHSASS